MNLTLDKSLAASYKSPSQQVRVMTESWVKNEAYCPNCGKHFLVKYPNNWPVADFFCDCCHEDYELKSKKTKFGPKLVDGEHDTMLERLSGNHVPNLLLLNYDLLTYQILNFLVIPKQFFVPDIIERRNPLGPDAQRADWTGCNILLNRIPQAGRIFIIQNQRIERLNKVRESWDKTLFLRDITKSESKGWLLDIIHCIELLGKKTFTLDDIYKFERDLAMKHPNNRHIKDKIRQQLQILRDQNYILFLGRGEYRVV
jgi:type II restriction enzyme